MARILEGSKGGGGSTQAPTEAPNSLVSVERARILDLLCEGPIRGFHHGSTNPLQDVYLNGTPVANADGTFNFTNVIIDSRFGTQDQAAMPGFVGVENEIGVGVELRSTAPWVQAITDVSLSAVRLKLSVPQLQKSDTASGNIVGYDIDYKIELATDGGAYALVMTSSIGGKATGQYDRTDRIDLPHATTSWSIRVTRLTANANLATVSDTLNILSYTEIIDAQFRYPNSAYVGSIVDAKQFSSVPSRAFDVYGRIMQVPSNYDPIARTYAGTWDGTFKPAWTNNPVWLFYDLVTHPRFGLGQWVDASRVNKWALYTIGQYCDELVPDGKGGTEPRFTCTLVLQAQADAYKVLADLSSVFRGMAFWGAGAIQAVADMPADPDFTYTNANVVGGKFSYQGSRGKTRFTVALVSWNDPSAFGKAKVAYVPDRDGIARYGVQQTSVIAVGATSEGQAQRWGQWILLSSRLETEVVTFEVGKDGTLVAPGRIARLADERRQLSRQGGRIHSATTTVVTLDTVPGTVAVGGSLTVMLPSGVTETQTISGISGVAVTVGTPFSQAPLPDATWVVETSTLEAPVYRILSIAEPKSSDLNGAYTVTAVERNASKFAAIDTGAAIQIPPTVLVSAPQISAPASVDVTSFVLTGSVQSSNVLEVSWPPVYGATKYVVRYKVDNGEWSTNHDTGGTYQQFPAVKPGVYVAQVAAANVSTQSAPTTSAPYTLADATGLPTTIGGIKTVASNAQPAFILNPNFADGLTNWTPDLPNQGWYETTGPDSPNPLIATYAVHAGGAAPQNPTGTATTALRNVGFVPISPGESFNVSAQIHNVGSPNGTANCRISWRDSAQGEISVEPGNMITRTGTSRASGTAPAGSVYAHAEIAVYGHDSNDYFTFTALKGGFQEIVETIDDANTTRTALVGDSGTIVHGTNASGLTITINTVAASGWLNGTTLYALQGASGAVKFVGAAGVTFAPADSQQTRALGSLIAVKMIADDVWEAVGDLAYSFPAYSLAANPGSTAAQPVMLAASADAQFLQRKAGVLVFDFLPPPDLGRLWMLT